MKKQVYSERRIRYLFKELRMHRYRKKCIYRKVWCLIINRLHLCTGNNSKTSIYLIDTSSWVLVPRNPSNAANFHERGSKLGFWSGSASSSQGIYIWQKICKCIGEWISSFKIQNYSCLPMKLAKILFSSWIDPSENQM